MIAGTSTFTVQVQDSEVVPVETRPASSASPSLPAPATTRCSRGAYSFLFNGFDSGGSVALAGTITADGARQHHDRARRQQPHGGRPYRYFAHGTYSIGSDGRGTLELKGTDPRNPKAPSSPPTTNWCLSSAGNRASHVFENNSTATSTDTFGTHGEGILKPVVGQLFRPPALAEIMPSDSPARTSTGSPWPLPACSMPTACRR